MPPSLPAQLQALKFPWMRDELAGYLHELADPEHQKRAWTAGKGSLDYIVHFLFDDTPSPQERLGYYLVSEIEVGSVMEVVNALDRILAQYGTELTDQEYIEKPEWTQVLQAARRALDVLGGTEAG